MTESHAFDLSPLLAPASVAVVGATPRPDASGQIVLRNLRELGYEGRVYPVNPRYEEVLGLRCYPSLAALPEAVDTAFLAVPAAAGPELALEAARCGVRALCINASGYADSGPEGEARQRRVRDIAAEHAMAVCGPNNMGLVNVWSKAALWMSDFPRIRPGPLAIVSQSGSVAMALSQDPRDIGIGYVVTVGNEAVCDIADYLEFIAGDERIRTLAVFVESLRRPQAFAAAVRAASARGKRVLALKVGRSAAAQGAVLNHSGALAGEDAVVGAFLRHHGVPRSSDLDELLESCVLSVACPHPPRARAVAAVTLSGGEAAMIADLAETLGLHLPPFRPDTAGALREVLPPVSAASNPLDLWGYGWNAELVSRVLGVLLADDSIGPVVCFGDPPLAGGNDAQYVRELAVLMAGHARAHPGRLILVNNLAGVGLRDDIRAPLGRAGIPYLRGTRPALAALRGWQEGAPVDAPAIARRAADAAALRLSSEGEIADASAFALLREAGICVSPHAVVVPGGDLAGAAREIGFPVALKASVPGLAHKSDHGLVRLSIGSESGLRLAAAAIRAALRERDMSDAALLVQTMVGPGVELFVAARNVPGYGTVVLAGPGGIHVEVLRDQSFRIGPLGEGEACRMLHETHAATLLSGVRGSARGDLEAAAAALSSLSHLVAALSETLVSIEINPLIVLPEGRGAVAVDAVVEVRRDRANDSDS